SWFCDSAPMKRSLLILLPVLLSACVVDTVAKTAVDVVTIPVKVATAGVNAVVPNQKKADEKRGKELRKEDEERGKQARLAEERCRKGKALPTDPCELAQQQR
ncbi:MAG TPA: hypothetical protein VE221_07015, partial [Sphingomicrobium sp.]|nr:hypothetical protein [Sphingomicrobium sp.]